jgi:curved DNA-binding protein CbpA
MQELEVELNYYDVLSIDKSASFDDIKKAYKKMALEYHPDLNKKPGASDKFKEIVRAYVILKDPASKNEYDKRYKEGNSFFKRVNFNYEKFIKKSNDFIKKIKLAFKNVSVNNIALGFDNDLDFSYSFLKLSEDILIMSVEELLERLECSNNDYVKVNSIISLVRKEKKSIYPIIINYLNDESIEVRRAVLWGLGFLKIKKSVSILRKIYDSIDSIYKVDILKAIYMIVGNSLYFRNRLFDGLSSGNEEVKIAILNIMLKLKINIKKQELELIFKDIPSNIKILLDKVAVSVN